MSHQKKQRKKKNAFGATSPPFIDYLKEILRRYPDGGQILKELIQNADDAGASETVFIYDERRYGTDRVWSKALGKYQGPALYTFNDAVFTENDWEGIQRVGRSIKQDDPTKVGRFGIGFNSVYHVTDLPWVFSSKHLAVFDPQKMMFEDEQEGYRWSLDDEEDRKHLLEYTDQFKPYQDIVSLVCNCAWEKIISEGQFNGTLLRFPLRSEASEISDNLYDSRKVEQLFDSFIADAEISLLFLRSVGSITLMHIDPSGAVNNKLKVSISCSSCALPNEAEAHDSQRVYVEGQTSFKTVSVVSPSEPETKTKWLVTTCRLTEGCVPEIDTLADKLHFHPQVDVGFQCDGHRAGVTGRLSCFLPLPNNETNNTGLPVHINACFGLTDNRRYIKWQEEDQKNDESAVWNELLKKEVLPHVYLKIIQDAIRLSSRSELSACTVYSFLPDLNKTEHRDRWHEVALEVYKRLFQGKDVFSLTTKEETWVAASEAVFPIKDMDTDTMSAVARLLIAAGENLVTVPEHVLKAINTHYPDPENLQWVTPSFVRTVLRKTELGKVSKDDKLALLEFVLSDKKYEELLGLQLLPFSDGSFRSFTNEDEDTVLIDNEDFSRALLPFCKEKFLPDDLDTKIICHLRQMAVTNPDFYKIINLNAKNLAAFAKIYLPSDWKETQGDVKWNYAKDGHPPKTWLPEFWKFLNTHWEELKYFIGMPLIPLEPIEKTGSSTLLARLEKNSTLIFQSSRESTLPDPIQKVVKMVGGTVIKRDECLKHHDIENYVLTASPKNVLQVFLNSDSDKVVTGFVSASLHEKEEFKTYMSSLDCVSDDEKRLLSALPLFRLMSGKYVAVESRQAVIIKSNPAIPTDLPVPETIVQCANEADRRLLTLLKVELLDAAQLAIHLVDCIERKAFRKEEEQKIMTWILDHGNVLFSQSEELLRKSRNLSFIETDRGERKQASSVFNHTNKNFQDLFEEDFFPPPVYRSQVILQSLKQLGLRTREEEISSVEVLHVASQIQMLQIDSLNKAFKKADALVRVLNRNDLLSNVSEGERRELLQKQWVPCENPNSKNSKSSQKRSLYKPAEIRSSKYSAIVGHVMPLTSELSDSVCQKLDLFVPPPAEKVLENLCVLRSITPVLVNPDSDYEFKNKVHSTYKFMQENIEYFREEMNKKCIAWLWCQNEFVSPRDVVLVYPDELDLMFYIKKVPEEFLQYAEMLKKFGIKETLSDEEIEDIFHDLKQTIDDREPPHGEPSELKLLIAILDWMRKNKKPLKDSTPVPVRAQNQNFTLEPLKNTVYCDISDEGLEDLRQDEEEFHVIHEEVLGVTAKWLKVPFLSTRILKPQPIITEEEYLGIEQCGQREPITQRIKNILTEFDKTIDIFKELIQNAEDAGASTCGFLVDFRTHPAESLFDDGMALCNGPCLWAYNNKLFSEEDWKNIVRVGSASKENKIEKIGNFGLGFNAVYHLTDIPSILSGKNLLILDPNVTHLEKHIRSKANPGIKLDLFQDRLFRRFPGQFRSYQGIFDCDLTKSSQNYYKGTLIKLPFRTSEEASRSEISCKVYDKKDINAFQQHFTHDTQSPLLFLKNMNSVSLQIVSEDASTPPPQTQIQTLLKISKEVVCSMKISNEMHLQDTRNALENLDSNYHKIVDCFTAHIAKIVHEHLEDNRAQYWLLYSCLGTKDSLRMFQREIQECKFSLPIGGVAVPLRKQGENLWSPDESCAVGQAFCFLPLPIETGLPVHIKGSFAVTSNRKALWQTGIKLEWNKALLQDANASAYIITLVELKKMAQDGNLQNYDYYKFWPDVEKVSKAFQPLVCAFYSAITQGTTDRSLELFSNGQTWCSMDKARFLHPNIERNSAVGELASKVFLDTTDSGYCAVPLPSWVRNSLIQCGFREVVMERTFHWVEFYQVVFKNIDNMDPHCRNALILNAIDLNDPAVDKLLKSTPCIPAQKTGKLQLIRKLVNPRGNVAWLYAPEEGRFLDGTENDFFDPRQIQRLSGLGMLSDTLPLEDVVERAETISRVWTEDENKAQKCLQCLFDCMRDHLGDVSSPHWETLKHISFLSAVITDQDNDVMIRLKQPSEVYNQRYYDLVNMTEFSVDHSKLHIQPNDPVLTKLGVDKAPPVRTVLRQLKEAHDRSDAFEKSVLLNMAKSCYDYLNKYLINGGDPTAIIEHAHSVPFVLIEGHFVNVRSVVKSEGFEEKPYLYVLPAIFSKFENLWNCVGMKNQFTAEQFVAALKEISAVPGPLSQLNLHTCLSIVTRGLYEAKDERVKCCLLPDEKGVLTYSSKLNYNDSPWMPAQAGVKLCHELVPRPVALHFGVVTTRHHTLKNHLVDGFCPFVQEFGQHEKLTVRIKNIIEAYPSKKDILKELIQNADDSEATEIHFVWDKRQHETEKIFGERWKLLQGPALCVYNNKPFSDQDLKGIQQLGKGGKHGTLGRTGKYGLGFNSVYQLTDCPSILTGDEKLCISDPNLKYVEGGTKDSPGCMYLMDNEFKESFKDVYQTFLPETFDLQSGTMFRFPLRTEEMAAKSEISRHAVTEDEIEELSDALIKDFEGLILFLKHITRIQFHTINADGAKRMSFVIESKREDKVRFHNQVCNSNQVVPTIYNMQILSGEQESKWVIAECLGSLQQIPEKEGDYSLVVPQAILAACLNIKPGDTEFTGRAFCSLPLPGETGLPVHVNGNFEVDSARRDLWKEDSESPRTRWNQSLKMNTIAPLYAYLLNHICTICEDDTPNSFNSLESQLESYLTYFPVVLKPVDKAWQEMVNEVYRSISDLNFPVIPTLSVADDHLHLPDPKYKFAWSTVSDAHFMTESNYHILTVLVRIGMNVVPHLPKMEKVRENFTNAGVKVTEVSPSSVLNYLTQNGFSQTTKAEHRTVSHTLCHSLFEEFSSDEADEFQCYLQSGIRDSSREYKRKFMSLPLFQTIFGNRLQIYNANVFILTTEFQQLFPDLYNFVNSNGIFLMKSPVNEDLSHSLNIQILGDLEYCVKFILPSVGKLRETKLLSLVKLLVKLRQKYKSGYQGYQDKVAAALRGIRFIQDIHGCLQTASYFFDDDVNLYKVMLPKERFVPKAFWELFQTESTHAKSLLKELGLKHNVSEEEIITFAHQIESDARGNTDLEVLKHRSSTLFKTVFKKSTEENSKLMDRIATIKFIFPVQIESQLQDFHKAFAQGRDAVAIKGSLLERDPRHQYLIWTAMPILPTKDCSTTHLDALKCGGALEKPPSEQVMQNLKNICRSPCNSDILVGTRATVFSGSYAYLQSVDFDASVLADLPLVFTENDTNLVKASQAVLTLPNPNEFRPYLYPVQGKHMIYVEFFRKIGVQEKPTVEQLCTVLQEIYTECINKTTLQPNQQTTVQHVVQQLFSLIADEPEAAHFHKNTLYLPSTDGKLYESSTLFFNDTAFQAKRLKDSLKTKLKLLVSLNQCHLGNDHYEHQKLLQLLPEVIRPKLLSQVISESLVHAQVERCDYNMECEFGGWFKKHLSSKEAFHHGLICLIREQSKGTVLHTDAAQMCDRIFGKIQIFCCKTLQTELLLCQEPLEGTQTETQVCVQKMEGGCVFYLKHNDNMAPKVVNEVTMHLTKEINALLQNILNALSLPVLGQLLLCENMEDIERALEQNCIRNSVSEEGFGVHPSPGSPIQEEWHDSLDMSPLNSFEKGEYVGFRKDESKNEYFFAIIVERLDELPGGIRLNPPRYKIQIGSDEFIEVSSLDLYQFKRETRAGTDEFTEESSPDVHQMFRRDARSASVNNGISTDFMPEPARASQRRPIPQTLEEIKREIDQSLKEIWNMSPEDKCKALRRLYLRWHPDKNLDNQDLANEAFKYLNNKIDELERGKTTCNTSASSTNSRNYRSRWNEEAESHRKGREQFQRKNSEQQYNFWSYFKETPRPEQNREEAKRWYKQAQCDLSAAQSESAGEESPEWCLFKVHQAVEKALIATEYRRSGRHPGNCSITSLAQKVSHYSTNLRDLPSAVARLSALGVDAKKTQYPNYHPAPHIPHEQFKSEDARRAVNIATELLTKLDKYITE